MWILNKNNEAVNLSQSRTVYNNLSGDVIANFEDYDVILYSFSDVSDAEVCIEMLVDCLNGIIPISNVLFWLKRCKSLKNNLDILKD